MLWHTLQDTGHPRSNESSGPKCQQCPSQESLLGASVQVSPTGQRKSFLASRQTWEEADRWQWLKDGPGTRLPPSCVTVTSLCSLKQGCALHGDDKGNCLHSCQGMKKRSEARGLADASDRQMSDVDTGVTSALLRGSPGERFTLPLCLWPPAARPPQGRSQAQPNVPPAALGRSSPQPSLIPPEFGVQPH